MSAPVLTKKEQNKSLSGIKSRKKPQKNVLTAPDVVKIRKPVVDDTYITKITETLKLLLPNARLPHQRSDEKKKSDQTAEQSNENLVEAKSNRNQLFLGINSISRGVSNDSVACIIFADDVMPKLLISHLIVLCTLKHIPYLYIDNLRGITKMTLGFSCIALGVKKNSSFFSSLITQVISSTEMQQNNNCKRETQIKNKEISVKDAEEKFVTPEKSENKFSYLLRDCHTKRAFIPDEIDRNKEKNTTENFISVGAEEEVNHGFPKTFMKKISAGKTSRKLNTDVIMQKPVNNGANKKDKPEVPVEFSSTKVMKMGSNPNRNKKKFLKLKKKKRH